MRAADIADQLTTVLVTEEEIHAKLEELARRVEADYEGRDLLLVGVLKGAVRVMSDFSRRLTRPVTMDWMAVSSYGAGTKSSGVVQIRKDLDTDLTGKHVLIVEDIIDSGLTLCGCSRTSPRAVPHRSRSWRFCASPRRPRSRSTAATSASTFRPTSSWATASTSTSATATCATTPCSRRTCTAEGVNS